jgi:hypothetical protein
MGDLADLGVDERVRAQHPALTSSASDRAIALAWQVAPGRSMLRSKPKLSMTWIPGIEVWLTL